LGFYIFKKGFGRFFSAKNEYSPDIQTIDYRFSHNLAAAF